MKKILLTSIFLVLVISVMSQSNYYYNGVTARGANIIYNCLRRPPVRGQRDPVVTISNVTNKCDTIKVRRLDGKSLPLESKLEVVDKTVLESIIYDVMPYPAVTWFNNTHGFGITFVINITGFVTEVQFKFRDDSKWATIPPDKYYEFEQQIKHKMKFIITDELLGQNIIKASF